MTTSSQIEAMGVHEAITAAVAHADRVHSGWSDEAYALLLQYMAANQRFKAEDVRNYAHKTRGLPNPPDPRAWGGVIQRAAREGRIMKACYVASNNEQAHHRPVTVWQVL